MAEPLVHWTPLSSFSHPLSIPEQTLYPLLSTCSSLPAFLPILCTGHFQSGKSTLLTQLLPQNEQLSAPFAGRSSGVFVYPRPVQAGTNSLLLIKASLDFLTESTEEREAQRKILFSLLAVSAAVVVCVEGSEASIVVEQVQELRRVMAERMNLGEVKLVVVATEQLERSAIGKRLSKLREDPCILYCHPNDPQLQSLLSGSLLSDQFTPSLARMQTASRSSTPIQAFTWVLNNLFRLSSFPFPFSRFTLIAASWSSPYFSETLDSLQLKMSSTVKLQAASAQPLFIRYFDSVAINEILLQQIGREYEFSSPTAILTVLGSPGLGKSTLLNSIMNAACERKDLPAVFPVGSGSRYRNTGCTVLTHPISFGQHQLMLIDMEGLGGCEARDPHADAIQSLTLSAVLAMASVPCILFTNDVQSMQFAERIVEKISYWNQLLGLSTERIFLLFHDKLPSADSQNERVIQLVEHLNMQYFGGAEVIQVRNKPNFAVSEQNSLCEDFTYSLLDSSHFPKRNYSGSSLHLGNLLDSIRYVTKYYMQSAVEVQVDAQHKAQSEFFLASRKAELEAIYKRVRSTGEHSHLEIIFNEMFRQNISFFDCENAIELIKDQVNQEIVNTANKYRLRLAQIENCHRFTVHTSQTDLITLLEQVLDYLYREAWVITTFTDRADELKGKLVEMVERYSEDGEKMAAVLVAYGKKQENLRNWFIFNYTTQAAATLATGGLGAAANGTRAALMAARFGYAAAASGAAFVVRTAYGITTTLALCEDAFRMFSFSKSYPSGLFEKAKRLWATGMDKVALNSAYSKKIEGLEAGSPMMVMLVIGAKKGSAHTILNELVQCVSPFTCSNAHAFSDSKTSQCLFFSYYQHTRTQTSCPPCNGLIIYLRVAEKAGTKKFRMLVKIAASLLPCVSTVALHLSEESQMVKAVFDSLQSTAAVQMRSLLLPKVAVYVTGSNRVKLNCEMKQRLERCGCLFDIKALAELSAAEMKSAVVSLKRDMDHSPLLSKDDFEQCLRTTIGQANAID